jgi:hypothetical protein
MTALLLAALVAAAQPSFDCAKATRRVERLVCADDELATLDHEVGVRWAAVPDADKAWRLPDQRRWTKRLAEMCPQPDDRRATLCLRDQYARWVQWLGFHAEGDARARTEMRWDGKAAYTLDLRYPELTDARFAAFNAWAASRAKTVAEEYERQWKRPADNIDAPPSEVLLGFELPFVSPRFVTIDFEGYAYASGAAHGMPWSESVLFDVDRGRPVQPGDLFNDAGWIDFTALYAETELRRALGDRFWGKEEEMRRIAADFSLWSFRGDEAVVTFPVYAVASYADGPQPVTIRYEKLAPFLKPGASLPR